MPVIAVVNRKGGSGKSTLATNIAAWCAQNGWQVMLGDVDRQRSMHSWLSRRSRQAPFVTSWAVDRSRTLRPPSGTTHVVLDTPGALYDHHLAKLVVNVDALLVPIGPSVFDRDASLQFLSELRQLPRVSSGRCMVVAVGMRWPEEERLRWLAQGRRWDCPLLTVIPELPIYRTSVERGASIFDAPDGLVDGELEPWKPLLDWMQTMWSEDFRASRQVARSGPSEIDSAAPGSDGLGTGAWRAAGASAKHPPPRSPAQPNWPASTPTQPTLGQLPKQTATPIAHRARTSLLPVAAEAPMKSVGNVTAAERTSPGWWKSWFSGS